MIRRLRDVVWALIYKVLRNVQKCVIFYAFFIFKKKDDFFQCFSKRGVRNNDAQNQTVKIACF